MATQYQDSEWRLIDGPKARTGFLNIPLTQLREIVSNEMNDILYKKVLRRVDIPLATLREVASNDIPANAATPPGGILTKDTTPNLEFTNGDTDSALRLDWAASNSDAVTFQFTLPDDFDEASDMAVKVLARMGGATDTPTITVESFFDVGDTKVSDTIAAVTGTTAATYAATIAAADFPASRTVSIELTPGAHTTDTLLVHAIWVEYYVTSTPRLEYVNGDTDSAIRLTWAAGNVDKVAFQTALPPDVDYSQNLLLKMAAKMAGSTDTPTFTVESFYGEGDTKISDTSGALSSSVAVVTTTIAAADVETAVAKQFGSFELTPGTHATDALHVYALWIEYTRR